MFVSFIIPSYNSAHTVTRCLDSIYALPLKQEEFEVIFVDDCSTDNTCEIVQAYTQPLPKGKGVRNLILLRQPENHRQGAARNRGVKIAKGEYICFVDSDDAVAEGIVTAIRISKERQTDMTAFHHGYANEHGVITQRKEQLNFAKGHIFSGIEMQNTHPYWCPAPWGYIYEREFLNKVDYPFFEGVLYEDADFVAAHLYKAESMTYSPELGYVAYYREGSTTHIRSHKNAADYLLLGVRMLHLYECIIDERKHATASDDINRFAESILEGACWNIAKSCTQVIRLGNKNEIQAYYKRLDVFLNRRDLCLDGHIRRFYWNFWTSICLKHSHITTYLAVMFSFLHIHMRNIIKHS